MDCRHDKMKAIRELRTAPVRLRFRLPDGLPLRPGLPVAVRQTRHAFLFGCLLNGWGLCRTSALENAFRDAFAEVFNYATVMFHWGRSLSQRTDYEPKPDVTETAQRHEMLAWCRSHEMRVRGHTLVFFFQPSWVAARPTEERERRLWHRVERETQEFAGLIDYWDALNEPTSQGRAALSHGGRASHDVFARYGTTAMIKKTHARVRAADPRARLIINDWDTTEALETVLDEALAAGEGFDVLGFQDHCFEVAPDYADIAAKCERFRRFGVPLHFTEVMMPSCADEGRSQLTYTHEKNKAWPTCPEGEDRQAREIEELYTTLFANPAVEAITWWGLSDFLGCCDAPVGLLREDMSPKPAYDRVQRLIRDVWWTDEEIIVGADGTAGLRCFLGDYRARVVHEGQEYRATFAVSRSDADSVMTLEFHG